ncbi:MAG: glycosyltransferase family 2 protein [Alphaproteobacteria bacterium]|nr:glycosyltransferase family 2 protein [Alphaproteobacteria bacterium]
MSHPRLSALIVAHNEAAQLADCLETVRFADEIVVVLDRTTDDSAAIARGFTDHIIEGAWPLEGPRRMTGIAACTGDWILEIDADERVTPALAAEVRAVIATAARGYAKVPIANYVGGRLVRYGWGAYNGVGAKPILFSKGAKHWGDQPVHPKLVLDGADHTLQETLIHHVDRDLHDMIDRLNRYTTAHARDMLATGQLGSLAGHVRRMVTRFWKAYVQRKGYKEGAIGLTLALFAALYPILSYLKAKADLERR